MSTSETERCYRAQIVNHYNDLTMTGLPERQSGLNSVSLERVFVKLNTEISQTGRLDGAGQQERARLERELELFRQRGEERSAQAVQERLARMETEARRPQTVTLSVATALQQHPHLVITGGPGSGKTTLSRWLALVFAQQHQADAQALGSHFQEARLPILLELRRFASFFEQEVRNPAVPDLATVIANFVHSHAYYPDIPANFVVDALSKGRCLLILDGMDEIANLGARQELTNAINAFMRHSNRGYRANLLLITSRPHGFREVGLGQSFQLCRVKPFTPDDVAYFIRHWYDAAYGDSEAAEEAQILIEAIADNPRVAELATNPLLCTIIAIVYRNNRVLPNRRVELYLKCCEALLDTWERNKNIKESGLIGFFDWQTKLELLAPLAYWLHQESERLAAPEEEFVEQLAAELANRGLIQNAKAPQEARRFIEVIRDRSGILQGRGDGSLEFAHRTFQEYLAARHIAAQASPDYIDMVMAHLHEAWWREVHQLVIGYLGAGQDKAQQASQLLLTILHCYRSPWWLWRAFSVEARIPRWGNRLIDHVESEFPEFMERVVHGITYVILSPFIARLYLAKGLSMVQRDHHLAWTLQREFMLAAQGYADCAPLGTTQAVTQAVEDQAQYLLEQIVLDPGRHESEQPIIVLAARRVQKQKAQVIEALIQALGDSDWPVRQAATSLGELGEASPQVVEALIQALGTNYTDVRQEVVSSLVKLGEASPQVVEALIQALGDSDWPVRQEVASSLGELGEASPQVVEALIQALGDSDWSVSQAAASSLGELGEASPKWSG
ncbi:HEAT repeat domain-containing protein [Chloroflexi bacterium TSY]|nr:HEAT repeat domain-containing protein [Chloroflexi bacterium TSY]